MVMSRSLAIVPHRLRSEASRVLRAVVRRLPRRVQRLSSNAVDVLKDRWPLFSRLLGTDATGDPAPAASGPRTHQGAPAVDVEEVTGMSASPAVPPVPPVPPANGGDSSGPVAALPDGQAALIARLRHPNTEFAVLAAEALTNHPGEATVSALSAALENRDGFFSPTTRASAIRALSALLPRGSEGPLVTAVGDADAEVSLSAIASLVERNDPATAPALLEVLENPRGFYLPLTRRAAARGLLRLDVPTNPRLERVLDAEADDEVRDLLIPLLPWLPQR